MVVADELTGIDGQKIDPEVLDGKAVLVVNVASQCGLTPQYEGLERLQERHGAAGFTVLGVPCNQFAGQEPERRKRSGSSARRRTEQASL
jgi:glutathione peroxidase